MQTCRYIQRLHSFNSSSLALLKRYIIYTSLRLNIIKHLTVQQCYNTFETPFSTYITFIIFFMNICHWLSKLFYIIYTPLYRGGSQGWVWGAKPPKLKRMRHYYMLARPQNARNPISENLGYILKIFWWRMPPIPWSISWIPFSKILYAPKLSKSDLLFSVHFRYQL